MSDVESRPIAGTLVREGKGEDTPLAGGPVTVPLAQEVLPLVLAATARDKYHC